jgi:hypothetical protein
VHDRSGVFTGKWYCSAWGVLSSLSRLLSIRMTNQDGFHRLSSSSGGINKENLIMFCHE